MIKLAIPKIPDVFNEQDLSEHEKTQSNMLKIRNQTDSTTSSRDSKSLNTLGRLENDDNEFQLHTKEAFRLFGGRDSDRKNNQYPIVGGTRVASTLRSLWIASGNNNPYADWLLITYEAMHDEIKKMIDNEINACEQRIQTFGRGQFNITVLGSSSPINVRLGFKSPYGFKIAKLIVDYDYLIRLIKTLVNVDELKRKDARDSIHAITRKIRSIFLQIHKYSGLLMHEKLIKLKREDFVPTANAESKLRVKAANEIFGMLPKDVLTKDLEPSHSSKIINVETKEKNLLRNSFDLIDEEYRESLL